MDTVHQLKQCGYEPECATPELGTKTIPGVVLLSTIDIYIIDKKDFQRVRFQLVLNEAEVFTLYGNNVSQRQILKPGELFFLFDFLKSLICM